MERAAAEGGACDTGLPEFHTIAQNTPTADATRARTAAMQQAWAVADRLGLIGPACEQPEYNIFHRHKVCVCMCARLCLVHL